MPGKKTSVRRVWAKRPDTVLTLASTPFWVAAYAFRNTDYVELLAVLGILPVLAGGYLANRPAIQAMVAKIRGSNDTGPF
jgi:hypothetical protein